MNDNNPFEHLLFRASVSYYEELLTEDSPLTDAAYDVLLRARNSYLSSGGTRGEAQLVIAEGRLEAAMNRVKGSSS